MKFVLSFAAVLCMASLMALESFTTDFTTAAGAKQWGRDPYEKLNPFPAFGYNAEAKAFTVGKVTQFCANFLSRQMIDTKAGDVLLVKVEVKGTGRFSVSTENYGENNKYLGAGAAAGSASMTGEWQKLEFKLVMKDRVKTPTVKVMMTFRGDKGSEFMIRSFSVEKQAAK